MPSRSHESPFGCKGDKPSTVIPDGAPCAPIRNLEMFGPGAIQRFRVRCFASPRNDEERLLPRPRDDLLQRRHMAGEGAAAGGGGGHGGLLPLAAKGHPEIEPVADAEIAR